MERVFPAPERLGVARTCGAQSEGSIKDHQMLARPEREVLWTLLEF